MKPEMERVLRPSAMARKTYNAMSRWYDLFTGSEKRFTDIAIQMLDLQPNESMLEIGSGTGHALLEFAQRNQDGNIVAIDLSEEMLKVARKQASNQNVGLCQADGLFIPFADNQFDAVFISFTLELFDTPDIPRVLSECHRVLKTNGRLGIVSLAKQDTTAIRLYEWFHRRMPNLVDCRPIYLQPAVKEAMFAVQKSAVKTMWGLPVEIVIARK